MQEDHRLIVADAETLPVDDDLLRGLSNGQGRTGSVNLAGTGGYSPPLRQGIDQSRKPTDHVNQKSYQEFVGHPPAIHKT